jgi:hypothetical protein
MKQIFFFFLLLLTPYFLNASDSLDDRTEFMTPRNAVVEVFTNTGSYQGAVSYGVLNDYIRKNPEGIIPIVYHTYSPYRDDPFYQINKKLNLNRWGIYSKLFDMSLDNSAAVGGHYFNQDRNDIDSLIKTINFQRNIIVPAKMSISMTKSADSAEITLQIQSVCDYGNRVVFIYLMDTYYTKYEVNRCWDSDSLTPNKELYFRWIPRAIVPDEKGLNVRLMEGTDTTLKIKVATHKSGFLNDKKLYAIAILQSPTSTNLIQAVTTYNPMRAKVRFDGKELQTGDSAYIQIKRNQKNEFSFLLENPYDFRQSYNVRLFSDSKLFYSSLVHFDDTVYTLEPYEKRVIRFAVFNQISADFARIDIVIKPRTVPDPSKQEDAFFFSIFAMSEGISCVTLYTYPKLENDADALDNLVRDFTEDWAVCPFDVFMKGFNQMPIKLYYLMLDTRNIPTFGINNQRVNYFLSLLASGKGVILSSPYELNMAKGIYKDYKYNTLPAMKTFLDDKLGITLGTHYNLYILPTIPHYPEINVFGVPENLFGENVNIRNCVINCGPRDMRDSVITKTTDIESIKITGKNLRTKGFLKYDINNLPQNEFAAVSSEIGDGRLLYLGFGLENTNFYGRRNIIENTIYWLTRGIKRKRAALVVTPAFVDFGKQEIYTTKAVKINIKNIGDSSLRIKDIYIEKFNESFIFDTSAIAYKLEPGQSFDLPLIFEPKKRQNMETLLCIDSDAYYSPYTTVTLFGEGILTQKIQPPDQDDKAVIDIATIKKSDKLNINFKPNDNAKDIKITLIDSEGNEFNVPYSPNEGSKIQTLTFNKNLFSSEKYELKIEIDGKVITKSINVSEAK